MGTPAKASPLVVLLGKTDNIAEQWVNDMSGSTAQELPEMEMEGRPARLGLGAKHTPRAKTSADPIERRLRGKMEAMKRQAAKDLEEEPKINGDEEDDDDDLDSRTRTFTKKRQQLPILNANLQAKKKQK